MGARWAEGAGRSVPLSRPWSAWARWGLSAALWSTGDPVKGGGWRGVSTGAVPNADGTGGALRGGQEFSLVFPFGSRFPTAMLMQAWAPMYVPRGGRIPRWRQPPFQRSGGLPCINHARRALCRDNICSRVMNWVGRVSGGRPPSSKCNVVDIANVPQDHRGQGASRWIAILGSYR